MSEYLMTRIPRDLVERIDESRGDVPRERWIRRAIEERLLHGPFELAERNPDEGAKPSAVAQPAEQRPVTATVAGSTPARGASSSLSAKAGVKPIERKG